MSNRNRLDDIESMFSNWQPQPLQISESKLLSLRDNLRKTYLIVASEGECNATQVSILTGRTCAIESSYLNQLVRMGWLTKHRDSRTLIFGLSQAQLKNTNLLKQEYLGKLKHQCENMLITLKEEGEGCLAQPFRRQH